LKNRKKIQEITIIAILAGCNAALELTLGNCLHLVKFPLVGAVMVGIDLVIYTLAFEMVPRRGTITALAFISALLNFVGGGAFKPWAILAIIIEGILIDLIISSFGTGIISLASAGIATGLFTWLYSIFEARFFLGGNATQTLIKVFSDIMGSENPGRYSLMAIVLIIIVLHIISGILWGFLAWRVKGILWKFKAGRVAE
jgi:hypothetical protein